LPSYTAKPVASGEGSGRSAQVIDVAPREVPVLDGLVGRPLADGIEIILTSFERSAGAVSLRQIVDVAQRRNKLTGDVQLAQSQIAASVRADNAQRRAAGVRPRFRLAGGRVGLTEWLLDQDLARAEAELKSALARYRETAQRAFARKCNELPGHAFVELCATLLARLGAHELKQVRFPGASGAEIHFTARINSPAGVLGERAGTSAGLKLGIVIRKDGRDMGRERLTEFRGAAHHYDGAQLGWIMSAGQVLSGARDEANVDGALPVTLLDGLSIARLCEQYDVAVLRASNPVAIADVDFFEALRSS
jgi:restriction endonuclease Mrr